MSDITICPYCNEKLRIAAAPRGTRLRVKCRKCKNRFHPSQILDHGESRLNSPLVPGVEHDIPASPARELDPDVPEPALTPLVAAPEPQKAAPAPRALAIDPYVQESAYPPELVERRSERRSERRHHHRDDSEGEEPARSRKTRHGGSNRKQVKTVLVVILLFSGATIAGIAVWNYMKGISSSEKPTSLSPPTGGPASSANDLVKGIPVLAKEFRSPTTKRIVGIWDIRTDDERRGWYEFRADGSHAAFAWIGDDEARPHVTNWFLTAEEGESIVLEIGDERGGFGNMRMYLTMNSPDSFTVTRKDDKGLQKPEANRFVRRGARP